MDDQWHQAAPTRSWHEEAILSSVFEYPENDQDMFGQFQRVESPTHDVPVTDNQPEKNQILRDVYESHQSIQTAIQEILENTELQAVLAGWKRKSKDLEDARKKLRKATETVATLQAEFAEMRTTRDRAIRAASSASVPPDILAKYFELSSTAIRKIAKEVSAKHP